MKVDYIIVGCGLAGIAFCEQLRKHHKRYIVIDDGSQQSSKVAGGLYNPVNLKRFTLAWKADFLFNTIDSYYNALQDYLDISINSKISVLRAFASVEEQNNWFTASDKPKLSGFMSNEIVKNKNPNLIADFGLGRVLNTGKIDTNNLIDKYSKKLEESNVLIKESFQYNSLRHEFTSIRYKDIEAEKIVFSEGFGVKQNPFFAYLPLVGNKGEYILVKAPDLKVDFALKGSIFVIPLEKDEYLVGATYDNQDKTQGITNGKRIELISKLKKLICCDFKVIDQIAAIRPTVKDRKPLVGLHPDYKNMAVLNGLGTRGVMASPYLSEQLYDHLENDEPLDSDIDIKRYSPLFTG